MRALALAALLLGAVPAAAETRADAGTFEFSIRGLRAGILSFAGSADARSYAVKGRLTSAGLFGAVRHVSYDAEARGRIRGGRFVPERYAEAASTGERTSSAAMDYRSGVPQVKAHIPPQPPSPNDVDPATQGGTVDPLTALYALLRDVPAAEVCTLDLAMFDGARASRIALGAPKPRTDGAVDCAGEYRRVAGFSAREMAEKQRFPFTVTYRPIVGGAMRVTEIATDTLYGRGRLVRQ